MNRKLPAYRILIVTLFVSCSAIATESHVVSSPVKAIVFDGFVIFDPRPLVTQAENLFPGHGAALCDLWRTKQFEYTWLRSMTGRYVDFWKVTEDALIYAAKSQKLELTDPVRNELMKTYLELKAWPDVVGAVNSLKKSGIRLGLLTNFTSQMIDANTKSAGLNGFFEKNLSTDLVKIYKPDPHAYEMAIPAFGLQKKEIVFAAFAGWDAAGAKSFGYTTFWVNRLHLPAEELDAPDAEGDNLNDLLRFVSAK